MYTTPVSDFSVHVHTHYMYMHTRHFRARRLRHMMYAARVDKPTRYCWPCMACCASRSSLPRGV